MAVENGKCSARLMFRMLLIAALALALGSCGRRGSPEPPPSASVYTTDAQGKIVERREETADRPFILDPLLQ